MITDIKKPQPLRAMIISKNYGNSQFTYRADAYFVKCSADLITDDSSNKHRELDLAVFSEKHESLRCLVTGKSERTRLSVIEYL